MKQEESQTDNCQGWVMCTWGFFIYSFLYFYYASIFCCCCNKLQQTQWLKTTQMYCLIILLSLNSDLALTRLKSRLSAFLSRGSKTEHISLAFQTSKSYQHCSTSQSVPLHLSAPASLITSLSLTLICLPLLLLRTFVIILGPSW